MIEFLCGFLLGITVGFILGYFQKLEEVLKELKG